MLDKLGWAAPAADTKSTSGESSISSPTVGGWKARVSGRPECDFGYADTGSKYSPRGRDTARKISCDSYNAPSVISKVSAASRRSTDSKRSQQSNGSMHQMIGDVKKDLKDTVYEGCILGGPLGPARTKEEIRNRKTLLISIFTGLFLVILFLILKEVYYKNKEAEDQEEIKELEADMERGKILNQVPAVLGLQPNPFMPAPIYPHPNMYTFQNVPQVPQHQMPQQVIPQPHPEAEIPQQVQIHPGVQQFMNGQVPMQHPGQAQPVNVHTLQSANQMQAPKAEQQVQLPNPHDEKDVDPLRNMYAHFENMMMNFVQQISMYTTDMTKTLDDSDHAREMALRLLQEEEERLDKLVTHEEQSLKSKLKHEGRLEQETIKQRSFVEKDSDRKAIREHKRLAREEKKKENERRRAERRNLAMCGKTMCVLHDSSGLNSDIIVGG